MHGQKNIKLSVVPYHER